MCKPALPFRLLTPILAALLATGCAEPLPTDVDGDADLLVVAPGHTPSSASVPIHLVADAVLVFMERAPEFGPPTFGKSTFGGRCTLPSDFTIAFDLWGKAPHLGKFTGEASHCSTVDFQTGRTAAITDGVLVFTAANGDELWSHYERHGVGEGVPEDHEFVGGTGRFANASGQAEAWVACDRVAGTCVFEMDGTLHYDASDVSGR